MPLSVNSVMPLAFSATPRTRYPTIGLSPTVRLATTAATLSASRTMTGASACRTCASVIASRYSHAQTAIDRSVAFAEKAMQSGDHLRALADRGGDALHRPE